MRSHDFHPTIIGATEAYQSRFESPVIRPLIGAVAHISRAAFTKYANQLFVEAVIRRESRAINVLNIRHELTSSVSHRAETSRFPHPG